MAATNEFRMSAARYEELKTPDERYFADTPERYYEPFGAVMPGLAHQEITLLKQERVK